MLLRQVLGQSIRIIASIILTRIISPSDFGIVAKALAITSVVELLFVNGLFGSIIQNQKVEDNQLNTLFILSLLFGFLVSVAFYFMAIPIADFYDDHRVVWVVKVASISIFFSGIGLVFNALLIKRFQFKQLALVNIGGTAISSTIALVMAYQGLGYKALVYQVLVLNVTVTVGAIVLAKWLPGLDFSWKGLKVHLTFGTNLMLNNFLSYAVRNSDNIAIGKFQSNLELGHYSRAYYLMLLPINQVIQIFSSTLFPAFSKIQEDKERVLSILNQVQEVILLLVYPAIIWLFINIDFLVLKVLGSNWGASIIYFKIFTPLILSQLFTTQINNVYMGLNRMNTLLKISVFTKPFLISAIIMTAMEGPIYVAMTVSILSMLFGIYIYKRGIALLGSKSFLRQIIFLRSTLLAILLLLVSQLLLYFLISNELLLLTLSLVMLILFFIINIEYRHDVKHKILELFKLV